MGHDQQRTHRLRVRSPDDALVPVPIGPGIPRRDRPEIYTRYCRLMLIFFKPWRNAMDLRNPGQSWEEAFKIFVITCSPATRSKMDNMQILHECRDSRDDHFAERRYLARRAVKDATNLKSRRGRENSDDFVGDDVTEDMILDHLEEISGRFSMKKAAAHHAVLECVNYAEDAGLYSMPTDAVMHDVAVDHAGISVLEGTKLVEDKHLEHLWEKAYDDRRDASKRNASGLGGIRDTSNPQSPAPDREHAVISDGSEFRGAQSADPLVPVISQGIEPSEPIHVVDVEEHVQKWTLNKEQAHAFRIIAHHSLQNQPEQLRMLLSGPGGTGKSQVINALRDFFTIRGQSRRLRLAAYTGVAARNINGMTLHASLCLNQRSNGSSQTRTRKDLTAMWEGVDYLFIDEVSMVGCPLLLQISQALIEAKGNTALFGGVNVIFAGDFAQLPPVGMKSLYSNIKTDSINASGKKGQNNILGKLLWLSIQTVVVLKKVERVRKKRNELTGEWEHDVEATKFLELLARLRQGRCSDDDFDLLNSRLITTLRPNWEIPALQHVPIIVASNELKDALNERAAATYAAKAGIDLNWYYAADARSDGTPIKEESLREHLTFNLHSGETNYRLGRLPLAIGMPVMVTQNFDVQNGIVNGSTGILKQIRYSEDESGQRVAQSCIVYIPDMEGPALPDLPPKHAAILADTVDMRFIHPDSGRKCLIKRTQVPLVPAFAMTAHKAQGKTMDAVIVDLESTSGTEAPYVMLSRATSLSGVYILRPFGRKVIARRPCQDVREEFRRLDVLCHRTLMEHGSAEEAAESQQYLVKNYSVEALPDTESTGPDSEDGDNNDARQLEWLQRRNARLIAGSGSAETPATASSSLSPRRGRVSRAPLDDTMGGATQKRPLSDADREEYPSKRPRRSRIVCA